MPTGNMMCHKNDTKTVDSEYKNYRAFMNVDKLYHKKYIVSTKK